MLHREADDRALVDAARGGDRAALDVLLRRHHDRLLQLCRRLAGNEADAQDATQEALLAIVRGLPRFDGRAAFSTWAYRVTTNACLDELRRRRRRPVLGLPDQDGQPRHVRDGHLDQGVEDFGDRVAVEAALAELPLEFRAPVVLRDLCDMEYADIAATLDIPAGTVRSRIARGRAHLARALGNPAAPSVRLTSTGDGPDRTPPT